MKKILALILAVVLCLSLCVTAFAEDAPTVLAELDKTSIEAGAGQDVTLTLEMSKEFGLSSVSYTVDLPDGFTLVSIESGTPAISYTGFVNLNTGIVSWYVPSVDNAVTTVFSKIVVHVPDDATAGEYAIGVKNLSLTTYDYNNDISWASKTASATLTINTPPVHVTGVTLNKSETTMLVGGTETLTATVAPANADNKNVTWTTSNANVATVNNGVVTGVGAGTATITVTTVDGNKTASCVVTVNAVPVDVTGVTLTPTTLNMKVGGTATLTAAVQPENATNQSVTWTTSNASVVTVNSGVVMAVGEGTATVTVAAADGRYTANCTITVEKADTPVTYNVTVQNDGHGSASATPASAEAGAEIALSAAADSGYHFKGGQVVSGSVSITNNKFTMPASDVTVKAIFEKNSSSSGGSSSGSTTYTVKVLDSKNGDVTASHKTASKGTAVTLTVTPDKGYVLDTLTVLDGNNKDLKLTEKNGKFTFTMPASKVTVAATFKASAPTGKNPFIDVPSGSYYEDAVVWAVEKGITSGTSAVTFDPSGNCTRAQAVTFLWRAAGSPAPKTKVMPFTDVPSGSYYYDAVLWAMEQGITKGTSDTAFSPNASCTRAQIVTFLWRANGSPAVSGNSAFTDVAADAYYAAAVAWAEKNGVTGGIGNGLFGSGDTCTRAQIVTFLYRAMK